MSSDASSAHPWAIRLMPMRPQPTGSTMRLCSAVVAVVMLSACGADAPAPEPTASGDSAQQPAATVPTTVPIGSIDDLPDDAISVDEATGEVVIAVGQVADLGGHADAIPAEGVAALTDPAAAIWIELGANDAQAVCYSAMFQRNGWSVESTNDVAERQAAFTAAEAEEFESC